MTSNVFGGEGDTFSFNADGSDPWIASAVFNTSGTDREVRLPTGTTTADFFTGSVVGGDLYRVEVQGPSQYLFDIDTEGLVFGRDSGGSVTIDFTNASGNGTDISLSTTLHGTWRTDEGVRSRVDSDATSTEIADDFFAEGNTNLRADISFTRSGNVITIESATRPFTFWLAVTFGGTTFNFDTTWVVRPTFTVDGNAVDVINGSLPLVGGVQSHIQGTFTDNSNATTALTEFGDAVTAAYAGVTVSTPTVTTAIPSEITIDFSSAVVGPGPFSENWDLFGVDNRITAAAGTTLADYIDVIETSLTNTVGFPQVTLTRNGDELTLSSTGNLVFVVNNARGRDTFNFAANEWTTPPVITQVLPVGGVGTTFTSGDNQVNIGEDSITSITIDTNTEADLSQLLVMSQNRATDVNPTLTSTDGVAGMGSSSYTLNDYAGTEIAVLTASSGESLTSILGRLEDVVDGNTETPIDFTAQVFIDRLVMTAQAVGSLNPGMPSTAQWTVTVDHGTGDGDIVVSGFTRSTRGRDTLSNINANVPTSGAVTFDNYHGATFGDN